MRLLSKYCLLACLFLILLAGPLLRKAESALQHGPIVKLLYAPLGSGNMSIPYQSTSGTVAAASTENVADNSYRALSGYAVTLGYFYDSIQSEFSYTCLSFEEQELRTSTNPIITGETSYYNIKIGKRFSDPGYSSYTWLYAGCKFLNFSSPYNDTSAEAIGFFAGFFGFHTTTIYGGLEFVMTYDFFLGTFTDDSSEISSDADLSAQRKLAVSGGMSLGLGFCYEPYDISFVAKLSPEINYLRHLNNDTYIAAGTSGATIGFEISYTMPNVKYNQIGRQQE